MPGPIDAQQLIADARAQLGKPYAWGADGPTAFDCSGLVKWVFAKQGLSLPHKASDQATRGHKVATGSIQPGDLIFYDWDGGGIDHVGIAISPTQMIEAPKKGVPVRVMSLTGPHQSMIKTVRRMPGITQGTSTRPAAQGGAQSGGTGIAGLGGGTPSTGGGTSDDGVDSSGIIAGIADGLQQAFRPISGPGALAQGVAHMFEPATIVRWVCGIAGIVFLGWGIVVLAKEVKGS